MLSCRGASFRVSGSVAAGGRPSRLALHPAWCSCLRPPTVSPLPLGDPAFTSVHVSGGVKKHPVAWKKTWWSSCKFYLPFRFPNARAGERARATGGPAGPVSTPQNKIREGNIAACRWRLLLSNLNLQILFAGF